MRIGVPTEIKNHEYRVGLAPPAVAELVREGHALLVQAGAGAGINAADADYAAAGASIVADADAVYAQAEMVVKVKEPQAAERQRLRPGQILFTYLHLAPDPEQANDLVASGAVCIAYETVTADNGALPLLAPMSEVAGRMAVQAAAQHLERARGGRGLLLAGVPGVAPAHVVVLGAGVVGTQAVTLAVGAGARVTVLDRSIDALRRIDARFGARVTTLAAQRGAVEAAVHDADAVIGAVLVPGAAAPKLVTRAMLAGMRRGAVIVDVAIDQGGCCETSRPTTHAEPTYVVDGVVHYCVANMPGAVPLTSTHALNNATLPFVMALAGRGWRDALRADGHLRNGLNVAQGHVTHAAVAQALGLAYRSADEVLAA